MEKNIILKSRTCTGTLRNNILYNSMYGLILLHIRAGINYPYLL